MTLSSLPGSWTLLCSLLRQKTMIAQLKTCDSLRDLRQQLAAFSTAGILRQLAASLPNERLGAVSAALGALAAGPAAAAVPAPAGSMAAGVAAAAAASAEGATAGAASAAAAAQLRFVGTTRTGNTWQAGLWLSLDAEGRPSSKWGHLTAHQKTALQQASFCNPLPGSAALTPPTCACSAPPFLAPPSCLSTVLWCRHHRSQGRQQLWLF